MYTTYALTGLALASLALANHCPENSCTDALRYYGKAAEFCAKYENHKKIQPATVTGSCEKEDTCVCPPSSTFPYPETLQPCFDDSSMADIEASCRECWFPNSTTYESSSAAPTSPAQGGLASSSPSNTQGASAPGQSGGSGEQGPGASGSSPEEGSKAPGQSGSEGQGSGSGSQNGNSPTITGGASGPGETGAPGNSGNGGNGAPGSPTTSCPAKMTTITYSDVECGCHKTTTVPIVSTVRQQSGFELTEENTNFL